MRPAVTLINLDDAHERRARMAARLAAAGVDHRRVGVDFRRRPAPAIDAWCRPRFPGLGFDHAALSGAEIGCWASHLAAWRMFAQARDAGVAVVLEDDIELAPGFGAAVETLAAGLGALDVVMLGTSSRNLSHRRRRSIGPLSVHAPVGTVYNTWGYAIARGWVERFLADPPARIAWPIDHFLGGRSHRWRPRLGVVVPALVSEDASTARASQIGPHTFRLDRARWVDDARRRLLAGPAGDLVSAVSRWL